jgi:hypothetical protein
VIFVDPYAVLALALHEPSAGEADPVSIVAVARAEPIDAVALQRRALTPRQGRILRGL